MEFKELQERANDLVKQVDERYGVKRDNNIAIVQLMDELGEFVRLQNSVNLAGKDMDKENLSEELGDVMIVLSNFASMNGIDLESAVLDKIEKVKLKHLSGEGL